MVKLLVTAVSRALNDVRLKAGQEQAEGGQKRPMAMAAHSQLLIAFCAQVTLLQVWPGVCIQDYSYYMLRLYCCGGEGRGGGSAMPMPTSNAVTAERRAPAEGHSRKL